MMVAEEFPFNLSTQTQKDKWLNLREWIFIVSIYSLLISTIPTIPTILVHFFLIVGSISLILFFILFHIENLIIMWKLKRYNYFWLSIFIGILPYIFYFSELYSFLKGQYTLEEIQNNKVKRKWNNFWKNVWQMVWKDDSLKGWIISILFLFIIIKFVFFPLLNLATGTALPLAIVESCSMYHQGNIFSSTNNWWERHDGKYLNLEITKSEFEKFNFKRGFTKGDILFIVGTKPEKLEVGDIIIFEASQKNPIIHRIINIKQENEEYTFSTIGDNNNGQLSFEKVISKDKIVGKASFRLVPYLGWVKLVFFEGGKSSSEKGFCEEN